MDQRPNAKHKTRKLEDNVGWSLGKLECGTDSLHNK